MNDYSFGNFVCMLREQKGMTQAELAQQLGVTPAAVSKWETGSAKPRTEVLFKLAKILCVKVEELLEGRFLAEETLDAEAVKRINERYALLTRIDSCATASVKFRRMLAWFLDWNIIGFSTMIFASAFGGIISKFEWEASTAAALVMAFIMISYPACFVLRDVIMNGRSLGKRITGLTVLDRTTGGTARVPQRLVRNLFLFIMQADVIVMLVSGRTIGDRAANTVVVPRKMPSPVDVRTINDYQPPKRTTRKKGIILAVSITAAAVLFVGLLCALVSVLLSGEKETEEYKLAYTYLVESEKFEEQGINEDGVRFRSYSMSTHTDAEGNTLTTAEFGFRVGFLQQWYVVCHQEDGIWQVCTDCTEFK